MTSSQFLISAPLAWLGIGALLFGGIWFLYPFVIFPYFLRIFAGRIQKHLEKTWFQADQTESLQKSVAVLFCAYNEESVLRAKLENLIDCAKRSPVPVKIHVFLDGCTDNSQLIAESFSPAVNVTAASVRSGKSSGMRTLASKCSEDVLIFTDANVLFSPELIPAAIRLFGADPTLGCIAGSTGFTNTNVSANTRIEGGYWKHEESLKHLESSTGSCLCGTGAIFAIKRKYFVPPPDDIIDDFHTTLNILFQRRRVIQSDDLVVFERAATKSKDEWKRKVRITCRAYNCYSFIRSKISQLPLPLRIIFYSHKWLRWFSAIPFSIVVVGCISLLFSVSLAAGTCALVLMVTGFLLGSRGIRPFADLLTIVRAFYATLWGVVLSLRGERFITWTPVESTRAKASELR